MATKGRKPIPKTQKEILISQQEPLNQNGPGFSPTGNPNLASNSGRAGQISFKGDTTKPFSIGIQDIDEAVFYYFQNVIKPYVIQNGQRIEVPIIYGSPEKWASFQKQGYFRDASGRIMMPIIMFKKENIEKVRTISNKLDANNPHNISIQRKKYSPQNAYSNFNVLNNIVPEQTSYAVVVPDYVNVTYTCAINTYYMDQLNKIIEAIEYASDSYWGDPSRFQFRAMIDSFTLKTELADKAERTVSSTFNIKLHGHIIPDIPQKDLTAVKKLPGINKIVVNEAVPTITPINGVMSIPNPSSPIPSIPGPTNAPPTQYSKLSNWINSEAGNSIIPIIPGIEVTFNNSSRLTSTYDFGYNIGSKSTWNEIWSSSLFPDLLDQLSPQHIRYPSGVMNYWDWDTQTTNTQYPLTSNTLPASEISFYKNLVESKNINTLWGVNMLTSSVANGTPLLNQQSASLLNITNSYSMPINKIELGSEFYTTAYPIYEEKYPSGSDYGKEAAKWMTTLRTILPSTKYSVPVVDTKFTGTTRRLSWNSQSIAEYVASSSIPDAFVIHSYPVVNEADYDNIANWVLTASYTEFENISASIAKIYTFSPQVVNKDIWITEYNIIDDSNLSSGKSISGTWAQGLYNLSQTFLLMTHPNITLGTHHSTHAGRYFGAILDSNSAFGSNTSNKFDFSATGILMGYFGTAYKDSDSYDSLTINDPSFIGKVFRSSTSGDKFIFMNLNSGSKSLNLSEILSGKTISSVTASYAEPTLLVNKITGSGKLTISQSFYTYLTEEKTLAYNMQPYEVTYIKCNI